MTKEKSKKLILIDLDGVLNTYTGGFDENFIPPPIQDAKELIKNLSLDFDIKIFTTRNKLLTSTWLIDNDLDDYVKDITNAKELCWLFVDDRCIQFDGNCLGLYEKIVNFKPWYKRINIF